MYVVPVWDLKTFSGAEPPLSGWLRDGVYTRSLEEKKGVILRTQLFCIRSLQMIEDHGGGNMD